MTTAMSPAIAERLRAGKLSQHCEPCGITEAAGHHCTKCGRPTGPDDWFLPQRSEAQNAASRAASRARTLRRAELKETAIPGAQT